MNTKQSTKLYALVDANNFYASCEKIFRPDLAHKALVVLSNNDGCIVARSKEAKALGIGMAEPYFKVKRHLERHNVAVFSSNYALYGDISQRIISILEDMCPEVDQYSIDEAFVNLDNTLAINAKELVFAIKERVAKWVGIDVSIGLARTRTLAKLANYLAKKANGIYYLDVDDKNFDKYIEKIPASEVWGIGRKSAQKLKIAGIYTALDLKNADSQWLRKNLSVTGWNTLLELRGIEACDIQSFAASEQNIRKSLVCSRSFPKKIYDIKELEEALSHFATNAAQRLRKENLLAGGIEVSMRTSRHAKNEEFYAPCLQVKFHEANNDTRLFIKTALEALKKIYQPQRPFAKAGIMLFDIVHKNNVQSSLLSLQEENKEKKRKSTSLMHTLDTVNHKFGNQSIYFASEGQKNASWHMRQEQKSQSYTSSWNNLAKACCK